MPSNKECCCTHKDKEGDSGTGAMMQSGLELSHKADKGCHGAQQRGVPCGLWPRRGCGSRPPVCVQPDPVFCSTARRGATAPHLCVPSPALLDALAPETLDAFRQPVPGEIEPRKAEDGPASDAQHHEAAGHCCALAEDLASVVGNDTVHRHVRVQGEKNAEREVDWHVQRRG
eukprot:scaffold8489_cov123-Isochrysis_galbana.AAC.4